MELVAWGTFWAIVISFARRSSPLRWRVFWIVTMTCAPLTVLAMLIQFGQVFAGMLWLEAESAFVQSLGVLPFITYAICKEMDAGDGDRLDWSGIAIRFLKLIFPWLVVLGLVAFCASRHELGRAERGARLGAAGWLIIVSGH